jgi:hypothetical protein
MTQSTCARCKEEIPESAACCPFCRQSRKGRSGGSKPVKAGRDQEQCPACASPVEVEWLYCIACGDRIEHKFMGQSRGYSCGPAAMRNALAVLGIRASEDELREVMGARPWIGTPDEGFVQAADALDLDHEHVVDGEVDLLRLETQRGNPCIVDWRYGQHYVCVVAVTDRHVLFVDSNPRDSELGRMLTHARFVQLWWDSDEEDDRHHAVHIFRKKR